MITLVLGGVRSGKSEIAEQLAGPGPGTYLATGMVAPGDDDFARRVARHQARRPASWATVEETGAAVPEALARLEGVVLLDALGTWIAGEPEADIDALVKALVHRRGDTIVVSEEVGLGVHPMTEIGRRFADRLGAANRQVAEVADRCLLVVAGRILDLPGGRHPTDPDPDVLLPSADLGLHPPVSGPAAADPRPQAQPVAPDERSRPSTPPDRNRLHPMGEPIGRGGFWQALAFLSPLGGAASPTRTALVWFPVVGALLGLVFGSLWWTTEDVLGVFGAAALVVAADLALTGALHFDGLLDSADGLLPHLPAERRLAVMTEPHIGAFALATGVSALLLRTAALTSLGTPRPFLLAALWCLSRTAMAVTALTCRYVRTQGLASSFLSGSSWIPPAAIGAVLAVGLALIDNPVSLVAVVTAGAAAAGVGALARRRIGGFTGDTLGAGGVVAETVGLLTAAAVLR